MCQPLISFHLNFVCRGCLQEKKVHSPLCVHFHPSAIPIFTQTPFRRPHLGKCTALLELLEQKHSSVYMHSGCFVRHSLVGYANKAHCNSGKSSTDKICRLCPWGVGWQWVGKNAKMKMCEERFFGGELDKGGNATLLSFAAELSEYVMCLCQFAIPEAHPTAVIRHQSPPPLVSGPPHIHRI